ncbi:MAG: hemolysin family protein, partial [Phycisphaeraceae bacterium]
ALLHDQRRLLITVMLGNMIMNVLYFVISAALVLQLDPQEVGRMTVAVASVMPLVGIILFGEVLPKLVANTARVPWVTATTLPLYAIHRAISPLGAIIARWVIQPLGRLVGPPDRPGEISNDALETMLEMSRRRGVIGADEQQLLREVLHLGELKVRDIMIPRVDIQSVDIHASADDFRELINRTQLTKYVACDGDLDHAEGIIYARQFLLAARIDPQIDLATLVRQVRFVPEIGRVDQLLANFRKTGTHIAIVVDEYGGTAGLVTLKDVVEQMVGDLDLEPMPGETPQLETEQLNQSTWRVSGRLSVHDWAEAFGHLSLPPRVSTVGGLVMTLLGHVPAVGDKVRLANLELEVERVDGGRVESVLLHLMPFHQPADRRKRGRS